VYALDTYDGTKKWSFEQDDIKSSPTIVDSSLYIVGSHTYKLDASDGSKVWSFELDTPSENLYPSIFATTPTIMDGTVYVGSAWAVYYSNGTERDGTIYAVDTETGDEKWRFTEPSDLGSSSPTVVTDPENGDSIGSRVELGTLGHHHVWAEKANESGSEFKDPLPGFSNPPQNTGGLHPELYEDLDGDGDGTDTSQTVRVFGELIRGNDLGVTPQEARNLNWNQNSPEDEVTPADMVSLFGEQIRAE